MSSEKKISKIISDLELIKKLVKLTVWNSSDFDFGDGEHQTH